MISTEKTLPELMPSFCDFPLWIRSSVIKVLRRMIHEGEINQFIADHPELGVAFVDSAMEHLQVYYSIRHDQLENIPAIGKVLIVANHPLGAMDAFALIHLVAKARQNGRVRILANPILSKIPQLQPILIPVDNINGRISRESYRAIDRALASDEAVIVFPAGEVSRLKGLQIRDIEWMSGFVKMAKRNRTPVLPVHIQARNSMLFYGVSLLYQPASTLLLPHEMIRARRKPIVFSIGNAISDRHFASAGLPPKQHARMVRKHLYRIGKGEKGVYQTEQAIAHPESRQLLREELQTGELIGETSDGKQIYLCEHRSSPSLMREIGRLREYTFRKVDEGSGYKRDNDRYDRHYRHIVLWDDRDLEVVGSYRIGECAEISAMQGLDSLYMQSLCDFSTGFKQNIIPSAIELGRSFVQPRYWGSRALDYLWQGIGAYLKINQSVRYMYGPVSLSQSYPKAAKNALIYFYQHYFSASSEMKRMAGANAMVARSPYLISEQSLAELKPHFSGSDYEADLKALKSYLKTLDVTIPTLFKQYSELCEPGGITFFDFGVDAQFGNCVDGYILADIHLLKESKRKRYLQ